MANLIFNIKQLALAAGYIFLCAVPLAFAHPHNEKHEPPEPKTQTQQSSAKDDKPKTDKPKTDKSKADTSKTDKSKTNQKKGQPAAKTKQGEKKTTPTPKQLTREEKEIVENLELLLLLELLKDYDLFDEDPK